MASTDGGISYHFFGFVNPLFATLCTVLVIIPDAIWQQRDVYSPPQQNTMMPQRSGKISSPFAWLCLLTNYDSQGYAQEPNKKAQKEASRSKSRRPCNKSHGSRISTKTAPEMRGIPYKLVRIFPTLQNRWLLEREERNSNDNNSMRRGGGEVVGKPWYPRNYIVYFLSIYRCQKKT